MPNGAVMSPPVIRQINVVLRAYNAICHMSITVRVGLLLLLRDVPGVGVAGTASCLLEGNSISHLNHFFYGGWRRVICDIEPIMAIRYDLPDTIMYSQNLLLIIAVVTGFAATDTFPSPQENALASFIYAIKTAIRLTRRLLP